MIWEGYSKICQLEKLGDGVGGGGWVGGWVGGWLVLVRYKDWQSQSIKLSSDHFGGILATY